ncbi:APC5 protein [Paecilomyces lecythidis]
MTSMLVKTREEQLRDRDDGIAPETGRILLSRSSPLGVFVRRAQLEFTRLQFHDSVNLWKGFIKYRLETYRAWARKNPSYGQTALDINLLDLGLDPSSPLAQVMYSNVMEESEDDLSVSTKDAERLLEFQVGELQRFGGRVPSEVKVQLERIISSGVTIPSLSHYLRFLDSWRAGDYLSAFDNLHRYFDYTMHSHDRSFYQYALLNLAILQADFSCYSEAISAMQEAISIARESHDMNCLNFCMSWLYHFGKAFPQEIAGVQNSGRLGTEKEGLAFLKAKAKETEMWSLLSTTLLSEAKLQAQQGEGLALAFENIVKASHLNVTKHLKGSMGPLLLLQISLFARTGLTHLSWLHCEVFCECYADKALLEDFLRSIFRSCQIVRVSLLPRPKQPVTKPKLAQKGCYKEAIARANEISPDILRSMKVNQQWVCFTGILQLKRQLHRDSIESAESLLSQLQSIQFPDVDISNNLSLLEIEFSSRKGDYGHALQLVEKAAQPMQEESSDILTQVKLLCLKVQFLIETGQPHSGLSLAIRAASIAHHSRVLAGLWEALCVVSSVLIHLGEFEASTGILESIIPQVLEVEDSDLTARCYSLLADASIGLAGKFLIDRNRDPAGKDYMTRALEYLHSAHDSFEDIEDLTGQCETVAKKATIMHLSGDLLLANDYAAKYLDLRKQNTV